MSELSEVPKKLRRLLLCTIPITLGLAVGFLIGWNSDHPFLWIFLGLSVGILASVCIAIIVLRR